MKKFEILGETTIHDRVLFTADDIFGTLIRIGISVRFDSSFQKIILPMLTELIFINFLPFKNLLIKSKLRQNEQPMGFHLKNQLVCYHDMT